MYPTLEKLHSWKDLAVRGFCQVLQKDFARFDSNYATVSEETTTKFNFLQFNQYHSCWSSSVKSFPLWFHVFATQLFIECLFLERIDYQK